MMSSYPLSRCPACRKAFRLEIKGPTALSVNLGLHGLSPLRPEVPALSTRST